jgi:hypothetical protein
VGGAAPAVSGLSLWRTCEGGTEGLPGAMAEPVWDSGLFPEWNFLRLPARMRTREQADQDKAQAEAQQSERAGKEPECGRKLCRRSGTGDRCSSCDVGSQRQASISPVVGESDSADDVQATTSDGGRRIFQREEATTTWRESIYSWHPTGQSGANETREHADTVRTGWKQDWPDSEGESIEKLLARPPATGKEAVNPIMA